MVRDVLVLFANLYRVNDNKAHDWKSVVASLKSYTKILADLNSMKNDAVSGPQLKLIKQATLLSNDELKAKSMSTVGISNLLLKVKAYYTAK